MFKEVASSTCLETGYISLQCKKGAEQLAVTVGDREGEKITVLLSLVDVQWLARRLEEIGFG